MKKFAVLFLCLILTCVSTFPIFAATSCEEWISESEEKEKDRIEYAISKFDFEEAKIDSIYLAHHIKDDSFFKKILQGAKISSFLSEEYDIVVWNKDKDDIYLDVYKYNNDAMGFGTDEPASEHLIHIFEEVDATIEAGNFGNVKNVSFLFYDLMNGRMGGNDIAKENELFYLVVWFVYIQSDNGEFLVPYVIDQDGGGETLENGKIYTLKECAKTMKENVYVREDSNAEKVNVLLPWHIALIAVLGVAALVGAVFGIRALIERGKTRVNTRYDF